MPHPNTPQISVFIVLDWEGAQKCFILRDQTTGDLKSPHLQGRVTLTALSVPPRPHFLSADLLCHISDLSQLCITVYTRNIIYIMREKSWLFLGHSQPLRGGTCPPGPPLGPALYGDIIDQNFRILNAF